jgi:hypothetical protein
MSRDGKSRLEIELELFAALERAQARYLRLSDDYRRMADGGGDVLGGPDGSLALARSVNKHHVVQWALEEYRTALKRFHRVVVVERKLPAD